MGMGMEGGAGDGNTWLNSHLPLPEAAASPAAGVRFGGEAAMAEESGQWSSPFMARGDMGQVWHEQASSPSRAFDSGVDNGGVGSYGRSGGSRVSKRATTAPERVGALTAAGVMWDRSRGECTPQIRQVLTAEEISMLKKRAAAALAAEAAALGSGGRMTGTGRVTGNKL